MLAKCLPSSHQLPILGLKEKGHLVSISASRTGHTCRWMTCHLRVETHCNDGSPLPTPVRNTSFIRPSGGVMSGGARWTSHFTGSLRHSSSNLKLCKHISGCNSFLHLSSFTHPHPKLQRLDCFSLLYIDRVIGWTNPSYGKCLGKPITPGPIVQLSCFSKIGTSISKKTKGRSGLLSLDLFCASFRISA